MIWTRWPAERRLSLNRLFHLFIYMQYTEMHSHSCMYLRSILSQLIKCTVRSPTPSFQTSRAALLFYLPKDSGRKNAQLHPYSLCLVLLDSLPHTPSDSNSFHIHQVLQDILTLAECPILLGCISWYPTLLSYFLCAC